MRHESEEQLKSLRNFFGDVLGFGANDRKPRVGKKKIPGPGTSINFAQRICSDNEKMFRKLSLSAQK